MDKVVFNDGADGHEDTHLDDHTNDGKTPEQIAAEEQARLEAEQNAGGNNGNNGDNGDDNIIKVDDKEYLLDDNGNALNEDGTIFKTKEELDTLEGDEGDEGDKNLIEIDGKPYTIDKDGNAIDKDGNVTYTKEQLDEMDSADEPAIDISKIAEQTAIVNYDENGNPIEYENTEEGYAKFVTDTYSKGGNEAIDNLLSSYPEVNALIRHLDAGNTLDTFNSAKPNYSKITLDKKDEAQLKDFIYKGQLARGNRLESIDRYYDAIKAGDTDNDALYEEAQAELQYLIEQDAEAEKARDKTIADQQREELIKRQSYWGLDVDENGNIIDLGKPDSVYGVIKSGVIKVNDKEFKIPEKIKVVENGKPVIKTSTDFLAYLYNPINVVIDGKRTTMTKHEMDIYNENLNRGVGNDVFDAFRRFTGYDDTQLVTEQVNASKVKYIKKLRSKNGSRKVTPNTTGTKNRVIIK